MSRIKPQPGVLTIWRIAAALAMVAPAFLSALLTQGSVWIGLSAVWITVFLLLYLVYLPLRYEKLHFTVEETQITLYSGVLYTRVRAMPLHSIQFTAVRRNPLEALFGLCSLEVTAAGGQLVLPGLRLRDAEALSRVLSDHGRA